MKQRYTLLLLFKLSMITATLSAQAPVLQIKPELSWQMLEPNRNLRKTELLMQARQKEETLQRPSLTLGCSIIAIADYQHSNRDSKFAYLMRHPTSANQIGKEVSEAVVHSMQLGLIANANDWMAAYMEMLYNPEQSFGQGTITSLGRNQIQLRKGFLALGKLDKLPLFLALGKMDVPFGQTGSVNPFSNSTVWHAFGGLAYGAHLGFNRKGLALNLMLIQGGAQFRAAHVPVDSSNVPSRLNNFSLDANYTLSFAENSSVQAGISYLHGSAYCQDFPVQHFNPCSENNPAWAVYAQVDLGKRWFFMATFNATRNPWPGTHNPNPPLDVFPAAKVTSMHTGLRYQLPTSGDWAYSLSAEYSDFRAGAKGSPWERQTQMVLGLSGQYRKASLLFLEIFATQGYAPLNFISGGNLPDPGTTHSDADARSFGILFGGNLSL